MTAEDVAAMPGMKLICTIKADTKLMSYKNNLLLIHPDHPPMIATSEGLFDLLDWVQHHQEVKV